MENKAPVVTPSREKPSIVETFLPLVLFYAATEPEDKKQQSNEELKVITY